LEKLELDKKLIIFDLDGTLINSIDQIYDAVCFVRNKNGYKYASKEYISLRIGLSAEELFFDLELNDKEIEEAVKTLRKFIYLHTLSKLDLFPYVIELLNLLILNGHLLAIATNKPSELAEKALLDCGIRDKFMPVTGGDQLPIKPNGAILKSCLEFHNIAPTSARMIGDRVEDMLAANAAGLIPYGISQGTHTKNQLFESGAKKVFSNIEELYRLIERGWSFEDL
jgi:phosphoglycolate phosphatase